MDQYNNNNNIYLYQKKRKEEYNNLKLINEVLAAYNNHKAKKIKQLSSGYDKNYSNVY